MKPQRGDGHLEYAVPARPWLPGKDGAAAVVLRGCRHRTESQRQFIRRQNPGATGASILDDTAAFANFMRGLAPPPTGSVVLNGSTVSASSISNGSALFSSIGCATCHNPTPGTTQKSKFTGSLGSAVVSAYSDVEVHHMGTLLTDNVAQGGAGGDQFGPHPCGVLVSGSSCCTTAAPRTC